MKKISRRTFLTKGTAIAGVGALAPAAVLNGCASIPVKPSGPGINAILAKGARVMWVAAHPDDEALVGAIMAKSSLYYKNPLYFMVLTQGEGGECCLPEGCKPDLPTIRKTEMARVAKLYRAELQQESYFNASLPVSSFPKRHEMAQIWTDHKEPGMLIARAIRKFRPNLLFSFAPINGFTGHPEHQLASRFATQGIRLAADAAVELEGLTPHKVDYTYYGLNKSGLYSLLGRADPGAVTEVWDARQHCINGYSCRDVVARFSRAHQTQDRDMGNLRHMARMFSKVYLQRDDPFTKVYDPFEKVK